MKQYIHKKHEITCWYTYGVYELLESVVQLFKDTLDYEEVLEIIEDAHGDEYE